MVDFTTKFDEYDLADETLDQRSSAPRSSRKQASARRELTGQERCSRQARFSRKRRNQTNFSGAPRRRDKRNYL